MIQLSLIEFVYCYIIYFICYLFVFVMLLIESTLVYFLENDPNKKDKKIISSFVCWLELASRTRETLMFHIKKTLENIDVILALMTIFLMFYYQAILWVSSIK